jgi:hypothetical protein
MEYGEYINGIFSGIMSIYSDSWPVSELKYNIKIIVKSHLIKLKGNCSISKTKISS